MYHSEQLLFSILTNSMCNEYSEWNTANYLSHSVQVADSKLTTQLSYNIHKHTYGWVRERMNMDPPLPVYLAATSPLCLPSFHTTDIYISFDMLSYTGLG
jgi:hypothetical protein